MSIDPWRYKLPCGHEDIERRASVEMQGKDAYDRIKSKPMYYCKQCQKHFRHKIDKKTDKKIEA